MKRTLTIPEFHATLRAQEVDREDLGFSCVGRFTQAGPPRRKPDGRPCNWTLGGLFKLHTLEVVDEEGQAHPLFELATP